MEWMRQGREPDDLIPTRFSLTQLWTRIRNEVSPPQVPSLSRSLEQAGSHIKQTHSIMSASEIDPPTFMLYRQSNTPPELTDHMSLVTPHTPGNRKEEIWIPRPAFTTRTHSSPNVSRGLKQPHLPRVLQSSNWGKWLLLSQDCCYSSFFFKFFPIFF